MAGRHTPDVKKMKTKDKLRAFAYIMVYLLATPLCILLTLALWLLGVARYSFYKNDKNELVDAFQKRNVLISGSNQVKALHLCRILGKAGHRIIIADTTKFRWSGTQYSKYVEKFYSLPLENPTSSDAVAKYVAGIAKVAEDENIDWFVPVSWVGSIELNLRIAEELKKVKPNIRCLTLETFDQGMMLDNKLRFMNECKKIGLRVPEFYEVKSISYLEYLRKQGVFKKKHFFLKPLKPLSEDRMNFTPIPDDQTEFEKYVNSFREKIQSGHPYFVCEFINGNEYSSGVLCSHGEILAINANHSSSMQIFYKNIQHEGIKNWTIEFCTKLKLTGLISFDFIEDGKTGDVYCIECNPRPHSNIVSFNYDKRLEEKIRYTLDEKEIGNTIENKSRKLSKQFPIAPTPPSPPIYVLYHEIGDLLRGKQNLASFVRVLWNGRDAVYMTEDPLPFLASNTIQMIDLLVQSVIKGKKFTTANHIMGELY